MTVIDGEDGEGSRRTENERNRQEWREQTANRLERNSRSELYYRAPLFMEQLQAKADAVLKLAHEGYLSDVIGVPMYEKARVDQYGMQKWKCLCGTNNVEGGPHGDIYRKFGALHGK